MVSDEKKKGQRAARELMMGWDMGSQFVWVRLADLKALTTLIRLATAPLLSDPGQFCA